MFKFKNPLTEERVQSIKTTVVKTIKYGSVFGTGVCVGTVCGVLLFFHIQEN